MKTNKYGQRETFAERLYRLMLTLYPRRFRRDYGAAMEQVFRELVREHEITAWLRVFIDLPGSLLVEHHANFREGGQHMRRYTYGVFLGLLLCVAIIVTNIMDPSFDYFGMDETIAMTLTVAVLLAFFVATGFLASRDRVRLASGAQVGALTALIGMGIAMLTFVAIDNLFLDIVSKQPDKVWNFQHGHYASMRTSINIGHLRGFAFVLPLLVLVGTVCGAMGAAGRIVAHKLAAASER